MRNYFKYLPLVIVSLSFIYSTQAYSTMTLPTFSPKTLEGQRAKNENTLLPDYTFISFYKPNYVLPYYYTGSPYKSVYVGTTPYNEQIQHSEIKFQLSFKVPLFKNIFNHKTNLMFAYTQLSYWQLYNQRSFIRSTDYEPEFFFANTINYHLHKDWYINYLNLGYVHQSNGMGNSLQRGWDRLYLEAIASTSNWMLSLKPWIILDRNSNNSNIGFYMGYAKFLAAYKIHQNVIAVEAYNVVESGLKRPSAQLTWSFPISHYFKGYVQVFSGYGQSLIEFNHHTNSAGIGLALNDWA